MLLEIFEGQIWVEPRENSRPGIGERFLFKETICQFCYLMHLSNHREGHSWLAAHLASIYQQNEANTFLYFADFEQPLTHN